MATIGPHHRPSSPSYLPWPNNNRDPYSLLSRSLKKGDKNPDTLHTQLKTKRNLKKKTQNEAKERKKEEIERKQFNQIKFLQKKTKKQTSNI